MKKKTKIIITVFIIVLLLIISGETYSRYVLNKSLFDTPFASAPFNFNAIPDDETFSYRGSGTILMPEEEVEFNLIIENVGDDVDYNTEYSISIIDTPTANKEDDTNQGVYWSTKFSLEELEIEDGKTLERNRTLIKQEATTIKFKLTRNKDVHFRKIEYFTIVVTSTSPYTKTITIPVSVYTEAYKEYDITYEIKVDGKSITETSELQEYDGITLDSVFGADRSNKVVNYSYPFNVTVNGQRPAEVYIESHDGDYTGSYIKRDRINEFTLGKAPEYKLDGNSIIPKSNTETILKGSWYENDVEHNVHIVVEFDKKPDAVYFDATLWTKTVYASGRGTSSDHYNGDDRYDIDPTGGWDWNKFGSELQSMKECVIDLNSSTDECLKDENGNVIKNGTYSIVWVFQTNTGSSAPGGFILDALQLNGVGLAIPFVPVVAKGDEKNNGYLYDPYVTPHEAEEGITYTITTLPNGAVVKLEYLKVFNNGSNKLNQRVYRLIITGATTNVTVTGGNINDFGGASEYVVHKLTGVNEVIANIGTFKQADVMVNDNNRIKEMKFRLNDYYENPQVKITNRREEDIGTVVVPVYNEADGYYYISDLPDINKDHIALLSIEATPIRYAIKYTKGEIESATFRELENWYDDNNGNYYTVKNSAYAIVNSNEPEDLADNISDRKVFSHWLNGNDRITKGQIIDFKILAEKAVRNEDGIYEMILEAQWLLY